MDDATKPAASKETDESQQDFDKGKQTKQSDNTTTKQDQEKPMATNNTGGTKADEDDKGVKAMDCGDEHQKTKKEKTTIVLCNLNRLKPIRMEEARNVRHTITTPVFGWKITPCVWMCI